jgi:hypothetical protein
MNETSQRSGYGESSRQRPSQWHWAATNNLDSPPSTPFGGNISPSPYRDLPHSLDTVGCMARIPTTPPEIQKVHHIHQTTRLARNHLSTDRFPQALTPSAIPAEHTTDIRPRDLGGSSRSNLPELNLPVNVNSSILKTCLAPPSENKQLTLQSNEGDQPLR